MIYRAIGVMSGSSLDGLDIAFAEFNEQAGRWTYMIREAVCYPYPEEWVSRLRNPASLPALEYQLLHADYGHYIGRQVARFIEEKKLQYQAGLVASHGHTSFHAPDRGMTAQLGDGAAIAAETGLPVVTDLRALDVAYGGQGAPIVPIGELLLLGDYDYFLNIGGIANLSARQDPYIAFDVCPANRVLNMLAMDAGQEYDKDGEMAAGGRVHPALLEQLNGFEYYGKPYPKSLANEFGTGTIYPAIRAAGIPVPDALRTCCEHIACQVIRAIPDTGISGSGSQPRKLLATGGGALNRFLTGLLQERLAALAVELEVPDEKMVNFKEALIMAFIGVLRWRQEYNVLASVTGARRNSIGGALWTGQDA